MALITQEKKKATCPLKKEGPDIPPVGFRKWRGRLFLQRKMSQDGLEEGVVDSYAENGTLPLLKFKNSGP